jgi:hypothetical protein
MRKSSVTSGKACIFRETLLCDTGMVKLNARCDEPE